MPNRRSIVLRPPHAADPWLLPAACGPFARLPRPGKPAGRRPAPHRLLAPRPRVPPPIRRGTPRRQVGPPGPRRFAEAPARPVSFPCPACGKNLKVRAELAGKKVKCTGCGAGVAGGVAGAQARDGALAGVRGWGGGADFELGLGAHDGELDGGEAAESESETLAEATVALAPLRPDALLVNCAPPEDVAVGLAQLAKSATTPIGVYPHVGRFDPPEWLFTDEYPPPRYVELTRGWLEQGALIVGGCCGTTPEHIAAMAAAVSKRPM